MTTSRKAILVIGDIACFIAAFWLFALFSPRFILINDAFATHGIPFTVIALLWICIFFIFNFYELRTSKPNMLFLRNVGLASLVMLTVGFIYFYIDPITRITPKWNLLLFEFLSLLLILGFRRVFYLTTLKSFHTRFAIVCAEEKYHAIVSEISNNPQLGLINCGTYATLTEFQASGQSVDLLIIHKIGEEESELLEKILSSQIEVIDLPEAYETILYKIPVEFIDNTWIVRSITKASGIFYSALSRIISIVFAISVTTITLPISIVIMIAIKLDDGGKIFIRQDRVGHHGKIFKLYKFRSMIEMDENGHAENGTSLWANGTDDPRITRVGKITRRLHVDEIPQLLNILKGDIALVGPRPERPDFVARLEHEIPYYFMRHTIMPGFTGWAQIKFRYARSVMDSKEKFEYDLFYIKNKNIFLDIGIIMKTAQIIFTH